MKLFACPHCNKRVKISSPSGAHKVLCPHCKERIDLSPPEEEPPPQPLDEDSEEERDDELEEERRQRRLRKQGRQKFKARRLGLERVNTGLFFHFISMFLVYLSLIALYSSVITGTANDILALILVGMLALAGLLELVNLVFCLWVPDGLGRLLLLGSMVLRSARFSVYFVLDQPGLVVAVFLVDMIGFEVWMLFLRRLAVIIDQEGFARQVVRGMGEVGGWYLCWFLPLLLAVLVGPTTGAKIYGALFFLLLLISAGSAVWSVNQGEGFVKGVFYPLLWLLGIHLILNYLQIINSLRLVIYRRG